MKGSDQRPNILLLMTDQQRFDTIAATGASWMKTPHLDRLAREGCVFRNAHTPNPICVPARYCHLTGTTERNHGITDNSTASARLDGLPTLPGVLSDNGYFTAAVGKMHFSPPNRHYGFDEMHLMEEIPAHRRADAYAEWLDSQGFGDVRLLHGARPLSYHLPQSSLTNKEHHGNQFVARRTIETITRNDGRQPFFIFSSWIHPHPPWNLPSEWQDAYVDAPLPEPIRGQRPEPLFTASSPWFADNRPDLLRKMREAYFASISMVDAAVGDILAHLDQLGITDETLIIFTSDHGEMLGDHGLFQKMLPYEQSVRIPFLVRYPRAFDAGSCRTEYVDLMDIMPTALDAAGVEPGQIRSARTWDPAGSSLLDLDLSGARQRDVQRVAYASGPYRWVMLRDQRYKYVHWCERGIEWFFDLETDPLESKNLMETSELPMEEFLALKSRAIELEERWGDGETVRDGQFVVSPTTRISDQLSNCAFPRWANFQRPKFGDYDVDTEAELFATQLAQVLAEGPWEDTLRASAPDESWIAHYFEQLEKAGVSKSTQGRVREILAL